MRKANHHMLVEVVPLRFKNSVKQLEIALFILIYPCLLGVETHDESMYSLNGLKSEDHLNQVL